MSHSKKNKQIHPNEGGITVLDPQSDLPPNPTPFEGESGAVIVQVSTDLVTRCATHLLTLILATFAALRTCFSGHRSAG